MKLLIRSYLAPLTGVLLNVKGSVLFERCRPHFAVAALSILASCGEVVSLHDTETATRAATPRILAMGDSMLAWGRGSHQSISDALEQQLNEPVIDRSVIGARHNYALPITGAMGLNIGKQYREGNWDWVVLNGGGNDLWFGCGCLACDTTIDKMISSTGEYGKIPTLVSRIRSRGARVIYLGYLHSPGVFSLIDHCKDDSIEFEKRIAALAAAHDGVYYLPVSTLAPSGDRSFHSADMIHPSTKASRIIAAKIASIIREAKW
ncbi:MAG: SGNH/GDSL hydrolase family protein [Albidovulum sp.]